MATAAQSVRAVPQDGHAGGAGRRLPLADALISFPLFFLVVGLQSPGKIVSDTKYDLLVDPLGFLSRSLHVWTDQSFSGQVQNQSYGYLFPHGAFFAAGELAHIPPWIVERLWWALALTLGFTGLLRLSRSLGIGRGPWRVVAALAFVASPKVLTSLGTISSEIWPMMLAPWVLLAVHDGLTGRWTPRRAGAAAALALALMGAVNAVATVAACLPALLWLLTSRPNRTWRRLASWWVGLSALASVWWLVPLVVLGGVAPPFLDYIESSAVTSRWAALVEVLRGSSAWVPYVSPTVPANAPLVSSPVVILATALVAGVGLAGLAMPGARSASAARSARSARSVPSDPAAPVPSSRAREGGRASVLPHRGRLALVLGVGLVLVTAPYVSSVASPLGPHLPVAEAVRHFLDGPGAPLRNVHKWEPAIRIPLVLGLAHALSRAATAAAAGATGGWRLAVRRLERPERFPGLAATTLVLLALALAVVPVWKGELAASGPHDAPAAYWEEAAAWLGQNAGDRRALVAPGSSFGVQVWGTSRDEPLQPLADSPWAVRDSIPLQPVPAIRALDSVQRVFDSGRPSPGLATTLAEQGIGFVVVRADLVPDVTRTRPALVHAALRESGGFTPVASFGAPLGADPVVGEEATATVDSGLRPEVPPVVIYAVGPARDLTPFTVPLEQVPHVAGGPEVAGRLDDVAALRAQGPVDPTVRLLAGDADAAGIAPSAVIGTDTPTNRETDFGRATGSTSALRSPGQERATLNPRLDYSARVGDESDGAAGGADEARRTGVSWIGGGITASSSAGDADEPGVVQPGRGVAALADRDERTTWSSRTGAGAFGENVRIDLDAPRDRLLLTLQTPPAEEQDGSPVVRVSVRTDNGTAVSGITPGKASSVALPAGETTFVEVSAAATRNGTTGHAFEISELGLSSGGTDVLPRREVDVPAADGPVRGWSLGTQYPGRSACLPEAGRIAGPTAPTPCEDGLAMPAEEPGRFARTLDSGSAETLRPVLAVRARPGPALDTLLTTGRGERTAHGASAVDDPLGDALAAVDGDPGTAWRAPENTIPVADREAAGERNAGDDSAPGDPDAADSSAADSSPSTARSDTAVPELTVDLPTEGAVDAVRITPAAAVSGARPEKVEIEIGGRTTRVDLSTLEPRADGSWIVDVPATRARSATLRITSWSNVRNDAGSGFTPRPVALGDVDLLDARGDSLAPAFGSTDALVSVPCSAGPEVSVTDDAGRTVSTVRMTLRARVAGLRRGAPVLAAPCGDPVSIPAGRATIAVEPGDALSVDSLELGPPGLRGTTLGVVDQKRVPTAVEDESAARRELTLQSPSGDAGSVLVVPQSFNAGWEATLVDGETRSPLTAVPVGGWQQGYVLPAHVPAGARVVLDFPLDTPYRAALATGPFALVLVLWMLLARGHDRAGTASTPLRGTRRRWTAGGLLVGLAIGGFPGILLAALARLGLARLPRRAAPLLATVLLCAGAALVARRPWPGSPWGGDAVLAQLLGLAALAVVYARGALDAEPDGAPGVAEPDGPGDAEPGSGASDADAPRGDGPE